MRWPVCFIVDVIKNEDEENYSIKPDDTSCQLQH
ncbi:MAG: hypothetical protein ACJAT1_000887 [Marivirga sp.]|jgi:hypothetical protein